MTKKFALFLFLLTISFGGFSQLLSPVEMITEMRNNGLILVRLHTNQFVIDRLNDLGKTDLAKQKEEEQKELNKSIALAFSNQFKFANYYFFYSDDSRMVADQTWNKVSFFDTNLEPISAPMAELKEKTLFIAEFGNIGDNRQGLDKVTNPDVAATKHTFSALYFSDERFRTLPKPFPYYSKWYKGTAFERPTDLVVEKMQEKLEKFFAKHH